jgi:parallel beta-helix repeat protein
VPGVDDAGGGAYIVSATVTFSNNQIFDNSVPSLDGSGGGLYSYRSSVTLANNIVISNSAHFSGGGLFLDDSASTLVRNTVASNTAGLGGGLVIQGQQSATITGNTVVSNTSDYGGGLFLEGGAPILDGNIIFSNTAQHGGGLFLENTHAVIKNTVIADNRASGAGSGLSSYFSYPRLIHTTFAHNSGSTSAVNASFQSTVNMTNTILVSHTIGVYASLGSTITLESTLWGSGVWANELDWSGGGTIMTGTHNYWGDPAFVNPNIGDYHIGTTSAAVDNGIDAGVAIDIDGEIRPFGTASDIGADEYVAALSVKAFTLSRSSMHSDHYQSTLLSPLRVLRFQQFQTWLNGG